MGYEVTHFDLSQDMINKAILKSKGMDNIKFIKGNAVDLSVFKEDEFDLVLCFDGAISFSGKNSNKVIEESCRVGKKLMLTVSNKSCMVATWLNYSLSKFGRIHPSVKDMMVTGYFNKANYDDASEFIELCDYDDKEVMNSGMGSFRRAGIIAIAEKINDNSIEKSK